MGVSPLPGAAFSSSSAMATSQPNLRDSGQSAPTPEVKKLKLADVRSALPEDTPAVTPAERDAAVRERRIKAQMRVVW